jgi:folate-binding protein YgfZ
MARVSPLIAHYLDAGATTAGYRVESASVEVVESLGNLEGEYAALRKHAVLLDLPQRGLVEVRGQDRVAFLGRMLTQELKGLVRGEVRRSFWLNRKGRIDADVDVIELGERTLLAMDVHASARAAQGLSSYVIGEDVAIRDASDDLHAVRLIGPTSPELLVAAGLADAAALTPGRATESSLAGVACVVVAADHAGEREYEVIAPVGAIAGVVKHLEDLGLDESPASGVANAGFARAENSPGLKGRVRLRLAGWHAFNIARIEAGTPLYNLDFAGDSLPAESGVLDSRVSFKKGCYLGQEVVARMHALGHPKQRLVGVRFDDNKGADGLWRVPETGASLWVDGDPARTPVGAVTSATISPMLGAAAIAFAMVKFQHARPGVRLRAEAEGHELAGVVQESLRFLAG